VGLAIAAGYVLGRSHKMKWALALAALAGRGRLPLGAGGLLQQGAKLVSSSPEVTKLTDEMRGRLVDAGKAAAVAAVSSKIDSLSDGLRERSNAMRAASTGGKGRAGARDEEDVEGGRYRDEDERYRDEDRAAASKPRRRPDEDEGSHVPAPRRPAPRSESGRARATRTSRGRQEPAGHGRAGHPSRHSDEGSGVGARQRQGDGRSRPRSSASRTGGDNE
jgi:hypothetical protein